MNDKEQKDEKTLTSFPEDPFVGRKISNKKTLTKLNKQLVIDALRATHGMVFFAARLLQCSHVTVYKWIRKHDDIREVKESYEGVNLDVAETRLHDAIVAGEAWAVKYLLSTKGKDRGYCAINAIENTSINNINYTDNSKHTTQNQINIKELTKEQVKVLLELKGFKPTVYGYQQEDEIIDEDSLN